MKNIRICILLLLFSLGFHKSIYLEPAEEPLLGGDTSTWSPTESSKTTEDPVENKDDESEVSGELEGETVSALTEIKDYFKGIQKQLKANLESMSIDSSEIKFVSNLPQGRGRFGIQLSIGTGLQNVDKGFNPVRVHLVSPTMGELQLPKTKLILDLLEDLKGSRLLNLILEINLNRHERKVLAEFKKYRDNHNEEPSGFEKFIVSIRDLMEPAFRIFAPLFYVENRVAYLKPVQVAGIKFALLLKTYAKSDKKKLAQELPLFFCKFLNSPDWDKSAALPGNQGKPWTQWTEFVKYEDPEVLDKLIPQFVKDIIEQLPLDVSLAEYLEIKDGASEYLSELSQVWRRGSVDSKAKYFIDNVVPMFESMRMNPTEIRKTAIAISTMCNDLSKANLPEDTAERLEAIIDDFVLALSKLSLVGPLSRWKNSLSKQMASLKTEIIKGSEINFDISKLDMTQDQKLRVLELASYYKKKAEQLLNYKHPGEDNYIFEFSELNRKQALFLLLSMSYRLHQDVKVAMAKAASLRSDISVKIGKKNVQLGPNAYVKRIGKPGVWNPRTNRWQRRGSGLIFAEQNALKTLQRTNPRSPDFARLKRAYSVAKDKRIEAQGRYAFDVARGIEIQIGDELKTPYSAFLGNLRIIIRRFENAKPLLEALAEIYESVGLPFPTDSFEEDLESSESFFDNSFFEEEEGFDSFVPDENFDEFSMEAF